MWEWIRSGGKTTAINTTRISTGGGDHTNIKEKTTQSSLQDNLDIDQFPKLLLLWLTLLVQFTLYALSI